MRRYRQPAWNCRRQPSHALVLTGMRRCGKIRLQSRILHTAKGKAVTINLGDMRPTSSGRRTFTGLARTLPAWQTHPMSAQKAFQRGVSPLLQLLLPGKEDLIMASVPDQRLQDRIDQLAGKSTEGELTEEERAEYEGYIRANKFIALMMREAKRFKAQSAA